MKYPRSPLYAAARVVGTAAGSTQSVTAAAANAIQRGLGSFLMVSSPWSKDTRSNKREALFYAFRDITSYGEIAPATISPLEIFGGVPAAIMMAISGPEESANRTQRALIP
jgi:hypothetical protein